MEIWVSLLGLSVQPSLVLNTSTNCESLHWLLSITVKRPLWPKLIWTLIHGNKYKCLEGSLTGSELSYMTKTSLCKAEGNFLTVKIIKTMSLHKARYSYLLDAQYKRFVFSKNRLPQLCCKVKASWHPSRPLHIFPWYLESKGDPDMNTELINCSLSLDDRT